MNLGSNFDLFDRNDSGHIGGSIELEFWVLPEHLEDAMKEADEIFALCDLNSDKKFSLEEMLKNWDEFVDSASTHYGKLLGI